MYSVIAAAVLSMSIQAPAGHHHGCHSCCGCSCYSSCCSCSGCWGCYGCCGCYGCHGCCGCYGCHGYSSCCGCCGGYCYGYHGAYYGSCGCCCGCTGGYYSGGHELGYTGQDVSYGAGPEIGYEGSVAPGGAITLPKGLKIQIDRGGKTITVPPGGGQPPAAIEGDAATTPEILNDGEGGPAIDAEAPAAAPTFSAPAPKPVMPKDGTSELRDRARVIVRLPAEARLDVDGRAANWSASNRSFLTPALKPAKDYFYTLTASAVRQGQTVTESKRVFVRAGQVTRVDFGALTLAAKPKDRAATSRFNVRLPEKAKLYVDGVAIPQTDGVSAFTTPQLKPGQQYVYTLKAELAAGGRVRAQDRKITFRAGTDVVVDFGGLETVQTVSR